MKTAITPKKFPMICGDVICRSCDSTEGDFLRILNG